jgi:Mor family transcriptional regulator
MSLSARQQQQLDQIIKLVEKVRASASTDTAGRRVRLRRSSAEAEKMRKEILAARAKGVSAAKLAEKYGVSLAYIYMIKE